MLKYSLLLIALLIPSAYGQETPPIDFSQGIQSLDDLYGELGNAKVADSRSLVAFEAKLVPPLKNDPNQADGYLVVIAKIQSGWHLYSITQPSGGPIRGVFRLKPSNDYQLIAPLKTASDLHLEYSELFDGLRIESHLNQASWIAPLRIADGKTLDSLVISGSFNGQVCEVIEGEAGRCVPLNDESFAAVFDPSFDATPLLGKAREWEIKIQSETKSPANASKESQGTPGSEGEYRPVETVQVNTLGTALLYAFLGGLILNVMPCVLPVIGLKILSFFEQAGKSRVRAFVLNLWYSLGLLSVFLVLAFLSVGLSKMFTFDLFNIIMLCVVFAMSLSLMDVWELRMPGFLGSGKSVELMEREGPFGAFFKGIITTLLAIPCGAPLLSPALTWSDEQIRAGATGNVFVAYTFIGLGMAAPYLLIGAFPELLRFLPKPGMWMDTFKKTMGFFLLVAVVWILSFLSLDCIVPAIALLFALWFACWLIGRLPLTANSRERGKAWFFATLVLAITLFVSFNFQGSGVSNPNPYTIQNAMRARLGWTQKDHWKPFSQTKLEEALAAGKPVLIDFTADWCPSCKWFALTVLHTEEIETLMDRKGVVSLEADCTKNEMEGAVFLMKITGQSQVSVPVLAFFTPEKPTEPILIRGGFYQKTVVELLESRK